MTPQNYCQQRTRDSGSSFVHAFRFLPDIKRRGMMALYAFCREVDDVADEISYAQEAMRQLNQWRNDIHAVFHGKPQHPVAQELQWACQHFAWDEELFYELMDGMESDIHGKAWVKASDLNLYCYRVAGVVGLLSIEVFGYQHHKSRDFATSLGHALQLTNILRDIPEDFQRGRIYIPQEIRARFQVSDQDLSLGKPNPQLQQLLQYYYEQAQHAYQDAAERLPQEDRISLRPSIIMGSIYHAQLMHLKHTNFALWQATSRISRRKKLTVALRSWYYEQRFSQTGDAQRYPLQLQHIT